MKTKEEILSKHDSNKEYPSYYHESNILFAMQEFAEAYHEDKTRWIKVEDKSMPKFYENYLISLNGTVQNITYQFVGKEVDEHWIQDDTNPAYWFQAEYGNEIYQIEITGSVLYQPLPTPPKINAE